MSEGPLHHLTGDTWHKAVNFSSFIHTTISSVVMFFYVFFFFFSTFSCTGNVNVRVVIPTGDQVEKLLSVVWKRNAELLNLLHVVEKVQSDDAGDGYCGLIKKY